MAYVNPGQLKYTIAVIISDRQVDDNDHYQSREVRRIHLRACIWAVKASDILDDGAARARQTLQFVVRYRTDLTTDMEIEWKGRIYAIESIDPVPYAGLYMRIRGVSYDAGVGC